jgi:hypothetical protein
MSLDTPDDDKIMQLPEKLVVRFKTPEEMIAYIDKYVANTMSLSMIDMALKNVNLVMENWREEYGEDNKVLYSYRKKLYGIKKKLIPYKGQTTMPSLVRRNIYNTPESLLDLGIEIESEIKFESSFFQELGTKKALFVLDCIGSYVNSYREEGPSETMQLVSCDNNPFYLINDTFENFCKRGAITGRDKRVVKEYLFGGKKKPSHPLNSLAMVIPSGNGKHRLIEMDFLTVTYLEKSQAGDKLRRMKDDTGKFIGDSDQDGKDDDFYQVDTFTMQLNYKLYEYLEYVRTENKQCRTISEGELKHLGYFPYPKVLTAKIQGMLNQMKTLGTIYDLQTGRALERNLDKFVRGFHYIDTKWQTGYERRESLMVVEWSELQKNAGFPKYNKGRAKNKSEDLDVLARIIAQFMEENEAFQGCCEVYCVRKANDLPPHKAREIFLRYKDLSTPFLVFELDRNIREQKKIEEFIKKEIANRNN